VRLLNGVGKPSDSMLPWSMKNDFPHAVTLQTMGNVSFPGRIHLRKLFCRQKSLHRRSAILFVRHEFPTPLWWTDLGVV
jgi:hypothetical protein